MTSHAFQALFAPISPDNPCGVDLDMEGDAEFLRFQAQIEGVLPASFLSFDRKEAGLAGHIGKANALIKRTADLRIACALAKLSILDGDLPAFSTCLAGIAGWLGERWPGLYPSLLDGDPLLRLIELKSLDDNPHSVLPLQSAPLFKSRRLGSVSLRSYLLADGTVKPRSGFEGDDDAERVPTAGDLASTIKDTDIADIMAMRGHAYQMAEAVEAIETAIDAHTGEPGSFRLTALKAVIKQLVIVMDKAAVIKDPSLAVSEAVAGEAGEVEAESGSVATGEMGAVRSTRSMVLALQAASGYFARHEPSSPVRMLLAQAESLIGKSFFDALSALAPDIAGRATIRPAPELALFVPLERLSQLLPEPVTDTDDAAGDSACRTETEAAAETEDHTADEGVQLPDTDGPEVDPFSEESGRRTSAARPNAGATEAPKLTAGTRKEALMLLENVTAFLRQTEPSSPIPFILDHARSMAGRDFMALLRELLPARLLRVDEE